MVTFRAVQDLLPELDRVAAAELESQELDFKEWNGRSVRDAVDLVVEMAVCMANGGGGRPSSACTIDASAVRTRSSVSPPTSTPTCSRKPSTTARIRIGTDCQPLTGTLRRSIMIETGETDFTAVEVEGDPAALVSAVVMERLRDAARRERAPDDLLRLSDRELLDLAGVVKPNRRLTRAGLLIRSDTEYSDPLHGRAALRDALARLEQRVSADNPITTVEAGPFHFEYRTYPEIALREALLNAFAHRDYRIGGPVVLKHYSNGLDVHSPGGFIGGVSTANVLHHQPVARNPHLVEALIRLRLVNRGNLGVPRMFSAMLQEGREAPLIAEAGEAGEAVTVMFRAGTFSGAFRAFVAEQDILGHRITVDHLLILHWLLRHPELPIDEAARLVQRPESAAREA